MTVLGPDSGAYDVPMKRRLPKGVRRDWAVDAVRDGRTRKTAGQLLHLWVSAEKRRTHKRERREGKPDPRRVSDL